MSAIAGAAMSVGAPPPAAYESSTVSPIARSTMLLTTQNALIATSVGAVLVIMYFKPKWAQNEDGSTKWNLVLMAAVSTTAACWFLIRKWQ